MALEKLFLSRAERRRRADLKAERWSRPLKSSAERRAAWLDMIFVDHGFFRLFYLNRHAVTPQFWRSAQPTPPQIRALAREGVRTVVSLRGSSGRRYGSYALERDTCAELGIRFAEFNVQSRGAPEKTSVVGAKAFLETLEYPALIHCKSGADRAGFMATLYLIVMEQRPVDEAMQQLAMRYGHFRFAKTGILDAFFELYRDQGEAMGLDFQTWAETVYDPAVLERTFRTNRFADLFVNKVLRRE